MRALRSEDWQFVGDVDGYLIFKNRHHEDDFICCKACRYSDGATRRVIELRATSKEPGRRSIPNLNIAVASS